VVGVTWHPDRPSAVARTHSQWCGLPPGGRGGLACRPEHRRAHSASPRRRHGVSHQSTLLVILTTSWPWRWPSRRGWLNSSAW